jgi:hypothetical protein
MALLPGQADPQTGCAAPSVDCTAPRGGFRQFPQFPLPPASPPPLSDGGGWEGDIKFSTFLVFPTAPLLRPKASRRSPERDPAAHDMSMRMTMIPILERASAGTHTPQHCSGLSRANATEPNTCAQHAACRAILGIYACHFGEMLFPSRPRSKGAGSACISGKISQPCMRAYECAGEVNFALKRLAVRKTWMKIRFHPAGKRPSRSPCPFGPTPSSRSRSWSDASGPCRGARWAPW